MVSLVAAATRGTRRSWAFRLRATTRLGHERCLLTLTYHEAADTAAAAYCSQRRFGGAAAASVSPLQSPASLIPHHNRRSLGVSSHHFYSTTTTTRFSTDSNINNNGHEDAPTNGPEAFQRYMDLCESLQEIRREKEKLKSEKMYQAWQKASSKDESGSSPQHPEKEEKKQKKKKSVAAGVAVVQTLAKQTRQERQQQQRQGQEEAELQAQATRMLQTAALEFDHPEAALVLGNQLVERVQQQQQQEEAEENNHGYTSKKDDGDEPLPIRLLKQALDLYQRAGELGLEEGWYNRGQLLWTGYPDQTSNHEELVEDDAFPIFLPADHDAAMTCFWKAIDLGDADAMYFVGAKLLSSDDDDVSTLDEQHVADLAIGHELLERAGGMDHPGALYYLALFHLNGHQALSVPACSPEQFVERLDAAVAAGNADAFFLRGHCFYHGENGYTQDYRKAVEDFLKATDGGNADAAVSAAAMLHSGGFFGVPKNQSKAFELYQYAGELGNLEGWRNVVSCYARGEGVPRSLELADYIAKTMLRDDKTITSF